MKIVIVIFLFFPYFLQAQLVEKTFAERRETLEKRYDKVGEFYQNGLVLVENTQKTLKIRKDGTPRTDTIYDEAKIAEKDFSAKERYSSKTDSLQLFLYDSAQKIVWQGFDYEYINLYEDSLLLFVVKKNNGEYGLLDSHFQEVIPPIYPIISTENGYILATDRYGKTGFFSLTGEQLLPCLYETLDMATSFFIAENPNWLSLKWENKYAVYDLKNKKYVLDWQPTYRIRNYYPQKKEFLIAVLDSVLIKAENKTLYSDDYASGITKAYCNASENQRLYPELWGIMDSLGHILLAPIYSDLEYYSQGNFYIVNNKSGGCILDSAKNCIYTFDISISSWKFLKNGKMGIINPVDSTFIPAKYKIINHLTHTGFFKASYDSLHYGIVKGQGEVAFPFIFEDIIYMLYASDNFGHIQAYTENKIYVFDDFAKLLHVFDRKNTLNRYGIWDNEVVKWRKKQGKWGVTNKKGEDIIPFIYDKITWKLAASYQKGYIGEFEALIFLNNEHKSVKKHFFNPYLTENYSEFVIGSGQETIAHNDAENCFLVEKEGKIGMVNLENEVILPFEYQLVWEKQVYNNKNYYLLSENKHIYCLDAKNQNILPQNSLDCKVLADNLLAYKVGEFWGFLDTTGKILIKPLFEKVEKRTESVPLIAIEKKGKKGYVDVYGKIAVPPIYDNLYQIKVSYNSSKMIYFGEKEGKWALMDTFWRKELTPFRYLADKVVSYSGISQSENVGLSEKKEVRILLQRTDDIFVMLNPINLMEYPLGKGITNYALSEK